MRRPFAERARRLRRRLFEAFVQRLDLAGQRVDLLPLRGDGLVQRLDGLVLISEAGFQYVDPLAQRLQIAHMPRPRKPWPSAMRSSNTKHSPRQRLSVSGTPSRYFRMPPLR